MIKLTPEQKYELATKFFSTSWNTRVAVGLVDAIEAEVLRINGLTDHSADAGKMVPKPLAKFNRYCCAGMCVSTDEQHEPDCRSHSEATSPRATGCPDTMDDTARFAADELPAILKKQAG